MIPAKGVPHVDLAIQKAFTATDYRVRVAAVAITKSRNIVVRTNKRKTHPWMARLSPCKHYLHAEVAALVAAKEQVDTLIVVRILRNGTMAPAKPCPICRQAIEEAQVQWVYYSIDANHFDIWRHGHDW